jgi:hypothetical protein
VRHAQDFVFIGKTGRGKTHLSVALGLAAVEAGLETRFFGTAQLVWRLTQSSAQGILGATLKDIGKADLAVLDEFGYIPPGIDGARLLFQAVSDCYERRNLVPAANTGFGKRGPYSPTRSSRPRLWTASSTTAGSWSSEAPAGAWTARSCRARTPATSRGWKGNGGPARPSVKPEKLGCKTQLFCMHSTRTQGVFVGISDLGNRVGVAVVVFDEGFDCDSLFVSSCIYGFPS